MRTTDLLLSRFKKGIKELRPIARERLAKGRLRRRVSSRFWGGFGTGVPCALCDKPIQPEEIEYKVKPIDAAVQTLRFHTVCHSARQIECGRLNRRAQRTSKISASGRPLGRLQRGCCRRAVAMR
jgi:hypothetical protein